MIMIKYPSKCNEFEIHAFAFYKLRQAGFDVRGEVKVLDKTKPKGFKLCRFDLVLFKDKIATMIVEVKRHNKHITPYGRQHKKYSSFGLPIYLLNSFAGIDLLIKKLLNNA